MRSENSGLIDLDALMKEASSGELPPSPDDSLKAVHTETPPPPPPPLPPPPKARPLAKAPAPAPPLQAKPRSARPLLLIPALFVIGLVTYVAGRHSPSPSPSPARPIVATSIASPVVAPDPTTNEARGIALSDLPAPAVAASMSTAAIPASTKPLSTAKLVALPDAPPSSSNDLGGAMRDAVGPRAPSDAPPSDLPTGSARQLKPSPGAVIGAINGVLPAARACLEEGDPPRNATVLFRSDGTVARVDLTGKDQAKDECIKGALMKARTQPFVDDSFAARATVRP